MVGLDVTMQVLVETPQYAELDKIDTPLGKVVVDWLKFYEKLHRNSMGVGGALHDPLALAVVIDPTLIRRQAGAYRCQSWRQLRVRRYGCRFLERAAREGQRQDRIRGGCRPLLQADVQPAARPDLV